MYFRGNDFNINNKMVFEWKLNLQMIGGIFTGTNELRLKHFEVFLNQNSPAIELL